MTKPTDSAFPYQFENAVGVTSSETGLTKREFFAAMALQGFLASEEEAAVTLTETGTTVAKMSVCFADALIRALNQSVGHQEGQ